jgi:NADH-quinone oxidoreductase subunit N
MTSADLVALLPLIVVAAGVVLVMLGIAARRSHAFSAGLTLLILLLALLAVPLSRRAGSAAATPLLVVDDFSNFVSALLIAAALVIVLLAYGYLKKQQEKPEEFYILLLAATVGALTLAASSHFASFFLGLEILSIALYAMIGYAHERPLSIEAGIKYLVLSGTSAAFLLFGMALIYSQTGSMSFTGLATFLGAGQAQSAPLVLLGALALILVGIGFKLALVPFHLWTPDVYEGAPAPVTAFIATISKGGVFAILLRFFFTLSPTLQPSMYTVFVVLAVGSMLAGNLLALLQSNLKRLLAYSSIANLGYLLVAFLAGGAPGVSASLFYLAAYFITILAAFGVVTVLSGGSQDAAELEAYRGLVWRKPWLAVTLTAALLSLAGIPLTVGFVGKFYLALAGVGAGQWLPVTALVISSIFGLYYYLRVIIVLFTVPADAEPGAAPPPAVPVAGGLALGVLLILMVGLGIFPGVLLGVVQNLAAFTP